ncbi:AraC family transcriptional regulator [Methanobrevibacter sp. YE315]|uniref:helix-turn-helix domain-containing protein n=1 Tax=Methanobrevibacter sp. YE315 TaxID=1609968 RepID=UPI000764DA42|nr:AraC family transcriptional regulator [Methanobrevibacter sp. YE315]AMD17206.1 AraC family transcriptional regulator [Methanobrevibacter sp. YE315]
MNENLYGMFDKVLQSEFSIIEEASKKTIELGKDAKYGKMETYSLFDGVIIAFMDINIDNIDNVFFEDKLPSRLLQINHCAKGRYSYAIGDDKIVYFGKGDLCVSIYDLTKTVSDFPLGYYEGLEIFIDVDVANEHIKELIPDFDLIELYESLEKSKGYKLVRANEKIDHVIGELYCVDERIKEPYFKLKCLELLLFVSIANESKMESLSLSKRHVDIVESVKDDLINDLESKITIDELADRYDVSKTTLKNCFKEVYGKPIFKWRKEYKLDYACRLIEEGHLSISEISKMVGYSSPSKFSQAFKDYVGCTPSEYKK